MKNLLLLSGLLLLSTQAYARAGQDKGNGGDICENKFIEVREDIYSWLTNGGSKNLKLPKNISHKDYLTKMGQQITIAKVSCTENRILVGKAEKTCKNFIDNGTPRIICNSRLFSEASVEDQYVLVHHEYAGLAGFETNNGSESSKYTISNQLSHYLEEKVVKKLAIKIEETLESQTLKKFIADANNPKSKLGATLIKMNQESIDGRNPDGIIIFPITRDDVKMVAISYDINLDPWHYGQRSDDLKTCVAPGDYAQYLILLATNTHGRNELSKDPIKFTVDAGQKLTAKSKDNSVIEYCDDVTQYPELFNRLPTIYNIQSFKLLEIPRIDNEEE